MHVLSIGLNHNTAPLEIRERAAVAAEHLDDALEDIAKVSAVEEATILSTCNRTEVYCHTHETNHAAISRWLCDFHQLSSKDVEPYLYSFPDRDAVRHAFRVASGLDSMVIGEPQILGQMKTAFATAHKKGNTGKILNRLFQNTFSVAKQVRSNTQIGSHAVSVAYAAVTLAKSIFSNITEQTVILIGAGETIELTCRHLHRQGVRNIIIANRTLERARELSSQFDAHAISLHELPTRLPDADMVFSSTGSTLPILGKGAFESALKKRRNNPMFVVDLAVPRDVETEVGNLNNVYLYTVDDLESVVNENMESRRRAALEAEKIVDDKTSEFMLWFNSLAAVPTLKDLRLQSQQLKDKELQVALRRLRTGENAEQVLEWLAHSLSQKLMHHPTESIRSTLDDDMLFAARQLFGLDKKER